MQAQLRARCPRCQQRAKVGAGIGWFAGRSDRHRWPWHAGACKPNQPTALNRLSHRHAPARRPPCNFRTQPAISAGATPEEEDEELQRAIGQLAELALLGAGRADELFPDSLDEMYAAAADEAPFRVML